MSNSVVCIRIDNQIKEEACAVLASMGLTVSDAFRIFLIKIVKERVFPFEPFIPNKKTIDAMKAARRGELVTVRKINDLLDSLRSDD